MTTTPGKTLEDFEGELQEAHLRGQWQVEAVLGRSDDGPRASGVPFHWPWSEMEPRLQEACEVMEESFTARRALVACNPGMRFGTTHTMGAAFQIIKPGEIAWAHRHTMNAIRFVIQGSEQLITVVDGEPCSMQDYDLVLTPNWTWHDHRNPTGVQAVWLDALDVGLAHALNQVFYEPFGDACQPVQETPGQQINFRTGLVRPVWEQPQQDRLPVRYAWRDVEPRLNALMSSEGSPYEGVVLEYVNPVTGGPALPTMGCWIQALRPSEATRPHRRTSSHIYFVVRGEGVSEVGDTTIQWKQHDLFVVPNWTWHHHENRSASADAVLFSINDIPALQALGFYREEPESSLRVKPGPLSASPGPAQ